MNRFMIAGTKSGCGKTTISCAILAAMKARGLDVCAFKAGPDYIDPGFHRRALGTDSHNLDSYFCDPGLIRQLIGQYSGQYTVIEGVMGFYDGGDTSPHQLSIISDTPVVIVIDCQGMSDSIGAVMSGYLNYRKPCNIAGFIFNRLPASLIDTAKQLCENMGTGFFGTFPRSSISFDSRHLGLVLAQESGDIQKKLNQLGEIAEDNLCIDKLLALTGANFDRCLFDQLIPENEVTIAVAQDDAFSFIYPENLDILRKLGCHIVTFSPLDDRTLPEADGLILCGGYPELHLEKLSGNLSMLESVRHFCESGKPLIAECGGFMYLTQRISSPDGKAFPMVGVLPGECKKGDRLRNFGYVSLEPAQDSLLFRKGQTVLAHEFHYWQCSQPGDAFTAVKRDGRCWVTGYASPAMYAGFPHLYFWSQPEIAKRFVQKCLNHKT